MKEQVPITFIAFPVRSVYAIAFLTGAGLAAMYSLGKHVQKWQMEAEAQKAQNGSKSL